MKKPEEVLECLKALDMSHRGRNNPLWTRGDRHGKRKAPFWIMVSPSGSVKVKTAKNIDEDGVYTTSMKFEKILSAYQSRYRGNELTKENLNKLDGLKGKLTYTLVIEDELTHGE